MIIVIGYVAFFQGVFHLTLHEFSHFKAYFNSSPFSYYLKKTVFHVLLICLKIVFYFHLLIFHGVFNNYI